jgi:hypothetical protein
MFFLSDKKKYQITAERRIRKNRKLQEICNKNNIVEIVK